MTSEKVHGVSHFIWMLMLVFSPIIGDRAVAQGLVPEGECAVIVASRKTAPEVEAFVNQWGYESVTVYATSNEWLAISIGTVRQENAPDQIAALKSAGKIPQDSYCSSGKNYAYVVDAGTTQATVPQNSQPETTEPVLLLFGGDEHDEFLGCLNCSSFESSSVCNEFGKGNEFDSRGIFNEFGHFGSEFSTSSPWNEFSTADSIPVVVDRSGQFYGYFTINEFRSDAFFQAADLSSIFEMAEGNLEVVRNLMCKDK